MNTFDAFVINGCLTPVTSSQSTEMPFDSGYVYIIMVIESRIALTAELSPREKSEAGKETY